MYGAIPALTLEIKMSTKLNRTAAAAILGISPPTLDAWVKLGKIRHPLKLGDHQQSHLEFDRDELLADLAAWERAEGERKASGYEEMAKLFASDPDPLAFLKSFKFERIPLPNMAAKK
jgi:hypothetical protein